MENNKHHIALAATSSCVTFFLFITGSMLCADKPSSKDANKTIVATVSGRPIYKKELTAGIPMGLFAAERKRVEKEKLERLVYIEMLSQFLNKNKIAVSRENVDKEIAELKKNPPPAGCSCCRYESLKQFLELNYFTIKEFRKLLSSNIGLDTYIENLWEKESKRYIASHKQRAEDIRKNCIKAYHIFFNVFQDSDYNKNPDKVIAKKKALAMAAWKRLKKGEPFGKIAEKVSEDSMSASDGGSLGIIPFDSFGAEFEKAARQLLPEKHSKPILSPWGYHIIKKGVLNEKNIESLLKQDFFDEEKEKLLKEIQEKAKINLKMR